MAENEANIVCPGCGGPLDLIDTVDNAGTPTKWLGCISCGIFTCGIEKIYHEAARFFVEQGRLLPYADDDIGISRYTTNEREKAHWKSSQIRKLAYDIADIDRCLTKMRKGEALLCV